MANQLLIPFKTSASVDIPNAVRDYIRINHPETHPDAFKADISRWETLRKDAVAGGVHESKIKSLQEYHAQLSFILTKMPADIGIEFNYRPVFSTSYAWPLSLADINYEQTCVLFNLASLYCQLGKAENRSSVEGIKNATRYFQLSAGTFAHIIDVALPILQASLGSPLPADLTLGFLKSMHWLMLAQAQECGWQKARNDNFKNSLIAKIATKVASLYAASIEAIETSIPPIANALPAEWVPHLQAKRHHFDAVANYRTSMDDLERRRYGEEIARLTKAREFSTAAVDWSRRAKSVSQAVQDDARGLHVSIEDDLKRASRDNDLIYHQDVPALPSLSPIASVDLARVIVPEGLDSSSYVEKARITPLFKDLLPWGARLAVELYDDRRANWIKAELLDYDREIESRAKRTLQTLHLPAALEAMERNIGLPPSLLGKAVEVRQDGGVQKIDALFENVRSMAEQNAQLLEEAFEVLDEEAEEDEEFREVYAKHDRWDRAPSHDVNKHLVQRLQRYQSSLDDAAESDKVVRSKWDEWEPYVGMLVMEQSELQATIPRIMDSRTKAGSQTQVIARRIRASLEQLDDTRKLRENIVSLAQRLVESDSIEARIIKQVNSLERWVSVKPEMFEDVIEEELQKYERFKEDLVANEVTQDTLLERIKEVNEQLRQSRQEDTSVKERERVLQSLNLAYHNYQEIMSNLVEGLQFYNQLAIALNNLRNEAKQWVHQRREEVRWLTESLNKIPSQSAPSLATLPGHQDHNHLAEMVRSGSQHPALGGLGETPSQQPVAALVRNVENNTPSSATDVLHSDFSRLDIKPYAPSTPEKGAHTPSWQPRSNIVKNMLATASKSSAPPLSSTTQEIAPPPWQQVKYRRELPSFESGEWEEDASLPIAAKKGTSAGSAVKAPWQQPKYAQDLPGIDSEDWQDLPAVSPSKPLNKTNGRQIVDKALNDADDWEEGVITAPLPSPPRVPVPKTARKASRKSPIANY